MLLRMSLECSSSKQKSSDQSELRKRGLEDPKSRNFRVFDRVLEPQGWYRNLVEKLGNLALELDLSEKLAKC